MLISIILLLTIFFNESTQPILCKNLLHLDCVPQKKYNAYEIVADTCKRCYNL